MVWNVAAAPVYEEPEKITPVVLLRGELNIELEQGAVFEEPGWTALDDVEGDISDRVEVEGIVDTSRVGEYVLTYRVVNQAGIASRDVTRVISVIPEEIFDAETPLANLQPETHNNDFLILLSLISAFGLITFATHRMIRRMRKAD
jgi:predicted aspartyl protease